METPENKIKTILELARAHWDRPGTPPSVRANFQKVCLCRTPALGAEIYGSPAGRKVFNHTCKSKLCPSCGNRATLLWQAEREASLPELAFININLTTPDIFWKLFKQHRKHRHDLPAIGAIVIQQWAWHKYRVRLFVMVIPHSFGARLNYNNHLHCLISAGGLQPDEGRWIESLVFDPEEIMVHWRRAVIYYFRLAAQHKQLRESSLGKDFLSCLNAESDRKWHIYISKEFASREHFFAYAGRYARRPCIAQNRILTVTKEKVVYISLDKKTKKTRLSVRTPEEFTDLLALHFPGHYKHSMRYFGLLAPRTKKLTSSIIFAILGQRPRPKPAREPWNISIRKRFGVDPLIDQFGNQMQWVGRQGASRISRAT